MNGFFLFPILVRAPGRVSDRSPYRPTATTARRTTVAAARPRDRTPSPAIQRSKT
ncbi:hypothetical protein [Variovorax sp. KK3]|uniref:hypothetical protein n=1 Tax=Variovorax sp. KK3 TaxID=1855728 RepID=UPI0015C3894B|nr:hypothetical protein [Variovorax sp. KK3]